jgi:pimeloyl-ACP methyl ester carboxylesterase
VLVIDHRLFDRRGRRQWCPRPHAEWCAEAAQVRGWVAGSVVPQGDAGTDSDGSKGSFGTAGEVCFVEGRAAGLVPVRVTYDRRGCGEPVVLLHGVGLDRRVWDAVAALLTAECEVIAVDLPGFGQSPDLPACLPRDLPTVVAALRIAFTELGIERRHVVGHSLGGLIALRLAEAHSARTVTALAPAGFSWGWVALRAASRMQV